MQVYNHKCCILKIKNVNKKNKYKRCYYFLGLKFKIPNKKKVEFYAGKRKEQKLKKFHEKYQNTLDKLNSDRKNKNPILTIYLLTYNHAKTIEKCILSLLNQNTQYPYIIRILDDASTDGTTDICFKYAQDYPEKIDYVLQPFNTKGKHFSDAIKKINTKYWCFIDGDDWWLTDDKVETAINFLENHEEYVIYGTDYNRLTNGNSYSIVHSWYKLSRKNQDVSFDNYTYVHPSARIHRNCIDWNSEFREVLKADYPLYMLSLSRGKCFFEDKIKSVWNFNGKGLYSSMNPALRSFGDLLLDYKLNKVLKFKFDHFFRNKNKSSLKYPYLRWLLGNNLYWLLMCYGLKKQYIEKQKEKIRQDIRYIEKRYEIKVR